jgi:nitric oxide reductase large subunit
MRVPLLGILGCRTYADEPLIPSRVPGPSGQLLFIGEDVMAGQEVFFEEPLTEHGSPPVVPVKTFDPR